MPIFLWLIYPIAIWSACAGIGNDRSNAADETGLLKD